MRELSLDSSTLSIPIDTIMNYGDTGSGKTTWSARFPRPCFLSVNDEGGHKALVDYPEEWLFEPHVKPRALAISEMSDMTQAINWLRPLVAGKQVLTVIVSSLSLYADLYLAKYLEAAPGTDNRQVYGALDVHLRDLRVKMHNLGCNVIWEAQAAAPEKGGDGQPPLSGRPLIPGKQGNKFPAGVEYIMYARLEETRQDGKVASRVFKRYTMPHNGYIARSRQAVNAPQLPNPLTGGYDEFIECRGFDSDAIRKALPSYQKPIPFVPVAASTPPVAKATTTSQPAKPTSATPATVTTKPHTASTTSPKVAPSAVKPATATTK